MIRVSLKGLWAHKRRLVGTFLAVMLGVAFLSGTLVLGDTLRSNFDELFTEVNAGTDAVVRSTSTAGDEIGSPRGLIDESLADEVRAVDGVARAEPYVEGFGELIGKDGEGIGGNGPPTEAANWIDDPDLNPYRIAEGRAPRADGEVVIDRSSAEAGELAVGDRTTVRTPEPVEVTIVGIATFGSSDGLGRTTFTAFTLEAAQHHITKQPDQVSSISVKAEPGVSQAELVDRLDAAAPDGIEAIAGAELSQENVEALNATFLDMLTSFLVIFAGIALLVGAFSIYNTFAIIVAQRTRESALLRAIGAGRGQVVLSIVLEAVAVGLVASITGLFAGVGIAAMLKVLFDTFGFALPAGGIVFETSTVVIALIVGMAVTLTASVIPAVRASRVPPLAALRDVAVERRGTSLVRTMVGLALGVAGVGVVLAAVLGDGDNVLLLAGIGAFVIIIGVVVLGPVVARPASSVIGWPLPRLRGVTGALARENAMRNPKRTAATASALMVGVGVVTLFTVFAASLKASIQETADRSFGGDLVISTGVFGGAVSTELATDVGELPEVAHSVGADTEAPARVNGDGTFFTVADPGPLTEVLTVDLVDGSIADLDDDELAVSEAKAEDEGWRIGSAVPVTFADGAAVDFSVGAIYEPNDVLGTYLMPRAAWTPHAVQDVDRTVLVALRDGVDLQAGRAAVEQVADAYGAPEVQDRDEYVERFASQVDILLGIVYVLLALAIVIALMGIANTLSLAIHERTRELGLLRAVGTTRGQLRSLVRGESVIIALFGTIGGIGVGLFLGWALVRAAQAGLTVGSFAAPVGQLAIVLVAGAAAGVLAGFRPARRAARLDVLDAIATE
ncbi:MAG: ABC transporter permease [Acidimicrobiales bacterium]